MLCTSVHNHWELVQSARQLVNRVLASNIFPVDVVDHLLHNTCPLDSINGFMISKFPIWKLGSLLGENYIEEDVMNCLSELLYFSHAASNLHGESRFFFLPTFFAGNASLHDGLIQGAHLDNLRQCLSAFPSQLDGIGFLTCFNDHYVAFFYNGASLLYADTLGGLPPLLVTSAVRQLLDGLELAQISRAMPIEVTSQNLGSGSCGVAAFRWIQYQLDPGSELWTNETSSEHRDQLLLDLLRYDMIAGQRAKVRHNTDFLSSKLIYILIKALSTMGDSVPASAMYTTQEQV